MSDLSFIEQNAGKTINYQKNKSRLETIRKLTHLYLHDKYIQSIDNLSACENLQVLYLHNNEISKIRNLEPLVTLKNLYLQKNKIQKIQGLETLRQLRKLYLGCNEISVLEGLEKLSSLEELHIEKQRLCKGDSFCFDPRTIHNLSNTLQILNISNNNITSLKNLESLKVLRNLNASFNKLSNIEEVVQVVQNWFYLTVLNFIGNPICKKHRYKDLLIANTMRLVILDERDINETTRTFIKRFEIEKTQNRINLSKRIILPSNMPGSVPPPLQHDIHKAIQQNFSSTILTSSLHEDSDTYLPWKSLKPSISDSGKICPPLFVKQHQHQQSHQQKRPGTKRVTFSAFPQL